MSPAELPPDIPLTISFYENIIRPEFDLIHKKFDRIDARFAQVDKRFAQIDARFAQMDKKFDTIIDRFDFLFKKVETYDQEFTVINHQSRRTNARLKKLEKARPNRGSSDPL